MSLVELVNEIAALVVQVVAFIFPISIAIYIFQFLIWKENIGKATEVVMGQQQRMSRKIICLFLTSVGTIFYAIATMIITSQIAFSDCVLWLGLAGLVGLLILTFYFFYSIFKEIGLIW